MKRPFLFFTLLLIGGICQAQYSGLHWSVIRHHEASRDDSAFIVDTETMMWKSSAPGFFQIYEGGRSGVGYRLRTSKFQQQLVLGDSTKHNWTTLSELDLAWSNTLDTCYLLSYTPMEKVKRNYYGSFGSLVDDTIVIARIPTSSYFPFLKQAETARQREIILRAFASEFAGVFQADTLYRMSRLTCDSNEYLPQCSYSLYGQRLIQGTNGRKLQVFDDPYCRIRLSYNGSVGKIERWDSTNQVEDPRAPGVFIKAPIKYVGQPKSILVFEKWMPGVVLSEDKKKWLPIPFEGYNRKVVAIGLLLSNGNYMWFKEDEVVKYLQSTGLNLPGYEQCFIAERASRMRTFTF
jgi:hypothetical protein